MIVAYQPSLFGELSQLHVRTKQGIEIMSRPNAWTAPRAATNSPCRQV